MKADQPIFESAVISIYILNMISAFDNPLSFTENNSFMGNSFSVTKSYLSTVAGVAYDQGLITSVTDKVEDYVWDRTHHYHWAYF